jgi:ParB family transcriptional regulator, chromosome partitioning protein
MNLRDKAAKISFDDLDDERAKSSPSLNPEAPLPAVIEPPAPRHRSTGVAAITDRINQQHQFTELQAKVAAYEAGGVVVMLDPSRVKESKWKNRHELAYLTREYGELKEEIASAGGNEVPIKVRRKGKGDDGEDEFEIVWGRRRTRACLELGFQVAAIVEELDDLEAFKQMERENRSRADLSPWEQGVMYKDALDSKLFASQKQMSAALNISGGGLSMALALASLPEEIIKAFPSPLELQFRWAADLTHALEEDTARVMTLAQEFVSKSPRPSAKEVLSALVGVAGSREAPPISKELRVGDRVCGSFVRDAKGAVNLKLKAGALTLAGEKKLMEFLERLMK